MILKARNTLLFFAAVLILGCVFMSATEARAVSLKETVEATVAYHPTIKSFQEYRQAAEHDLRRARSGWFPRVDARVGWGLGQWKNDVTRKNTYHQDEWDWYDRTEASLTISQIIWDGLATWNRVEYSEGRLDSAKSRLYDNSEGLGLDAVLAHIEIYRQSQIVALSEINVKNHESILQSQWERHNLGASTMADVTQTQSRLARTHASLAESRAALEVAQASYKRLTGKDAYDLEEPYSPVGAYPSLEVAQAHALTGNLKIMALRSDISSAEAQAGIDKSPFHPQIFLEAGPTYRKGIESTRDEAWGTSVMLRMNWNLFNGGYDWYNVKGSKARARQIRQELNSQIDAVTDETTASWAHLVAAQEQAKFFANAVQYATSTRDMYREQFNVSQRSLLDVLDSENELFSSSIQYVTASQNVIAAQYRLLTLGGELLSSFDVDRSKLVIRTDQDDPNKIYSNILDPNKDYE